MKYIIAIDQSTSGTKTALLNEQMQFVKVCKKSHEQFYPHPGYAEHDAEEIWNNVCSLLVEVTEGVNKSDIVALGIANQRETTVLWEKSTGKPVHKAIVWQDVRAKAVTDPLMSHSDEIVKITGLVPSPYYSAAKAADVLRNNPDLMARAKNGEICFGTIDSYLLYRLTDGEVFATDVSNASRTQLMDLETLSWSQKMKDYFEFPTELNFAEIRYSDASFGQISSIPELAGIKISSLLGDSHASFYGHGCLNPGMIKTSYGTGSSIMMNIGPAPKWSDNGLSTSVGFGLGGRVCYVLEGNVTCSADTLIWVRDGLKLIDSMDELDEANSVDTTDGVYLVPAFSGLGAPWFDENASGVICGINRGTTRAHILRAALASIAHQNADVLEAMNKDTGISVSQLRADGGGSSNPLLMQMQSDYVGCKVSASAEKELTLWGVAKAAGVGVGLFCENDYFSSISREYDPHFNAEQRAKERNGWMRALEKCR